MLVQIPFCITAIRYGRSEAQARFASTNNLVIFRMSTDPEQVNSIRHIVSEGTIAITTSLI